MGPGGMHYEQVLIGTSVAKGASDKDDNPFKGIAVESLLEETFSNEARGTDDEAAARRWDAALKGSNRMVPRHFWRIMETPALMVTMLMP